jgi:hypothetical protein
MVIQKDPGGVSNFRKISVVLIAWALALLSLPGEAQSPATLAEQLTTQERMERSSWWPTNGKASRSEYVGPVVCASCHEATVKSQGQHSMAKTSVLASNSEILGQHAGQSFSLDGYEYKLTRNSNGGFSYDVSGPAKRGSGPLTWAFGAGKVGQSYLSLEGGAFHELRFSYFSSLNAFGVTPNQSQLPTTSLATATGRLLSAAEAARCFGCHATASKTNGHLDPSQAMAGISCEGCHGPGAKHSAAMKLGELEVGAAAIVNPKNFKPVDLIDFCGACHTTWWDAKQIGAIGVATVRFQPYRLEGSRCWGKGDARLTCVACHDPHQPLVHDAAAYDGSCLSCHAKETKAKATPERPGHACPVAQQGCVSCHMPKYEVSDMHYKYTDHRIRVVKNAELFPE